jgi:hypothetical protein
MAFSQTELINTDALDFMKRYPSIEQAQFRFVDFFDQIPADSKKMSHGLNGAKSEQIQNGEGKRACVSMLSIHEGQSRPPKMTTVAAFQSMKIQLQNTLLASHKTHEKLPCFPTFEGGFSTTTARTFDILIRHLGGEDYTISQILC